MGERWDCVVVGGGAAGLSAALTLGRARRKTLLIDAGEPSNSSADGMGGMLGFDGNPPQDLYSKGRAELAKYPSIEFRAARVTSASTGEHGFELHLDDGSSEASSKLLLAMGTDYRPPQLPGVEERWGRSVFHCPFCHGWEVRDRPLGVLDSSGRGVERALLLRFWSDDVTLFTDGPADIEPRDQERLAAAGVRLEERSVERLEGPDHSLKAVVFSDGDSRVCEGLLVVAPMHQRSSLAEQLGAKVKDDGPIEAIEVDPMFRTSVPGLFAAGDVSATAPPSVAVAIAAGSTAAKAIVHDLVTETFPTI
jgi:thioredoxin reductase